MKLFILLVLALTSFSSWSQTSMKRCTLLPISDGVGGAIAEQVFIKFEKKIQDAQYCTYVSNSDLLHVFSRYKTNLASHLKTAEVLQVVSDKLNVGSLIRVNISNEIDGVELEMEVYGENGVDSFFLEKKSLNSDNVDAIVFELSRWMDDYSRTVPYDALVLGVLGEQVTIDVPKDLALRVGQEFLVKKLHQKKQHPLLKKIVEWDSEVTAQGMITSLSDNQALGVINHYRNNGRINSGDWIKILPFPEAAAPINVEKKIEPGKLGVLSATSFMDAMSATNKTAQGSNSLSGLQLGVNLTAEAWITRMYFAKLNYGRSLGSLSRDSGKVDSRLTVNNSQIKILGGYKFLPLGFFYGPQVDIYGGFSSYTFDLSDDSENGFSMHTIKGITLGISGNMPINNLYRVYAGFEVMALPSFEDSSGKYDNKKAVSSFELELGVKYQYNPRITFDGGLAFSSRKARFGGDFTEVQYRNNKLKLGASFTF